MFLCVALILAATATLSAEADPLPLSDHITTDKEIYSPGETVEITDGAVYLDGHQLDEPYIKKPPTYTYPEHKVPQNEYFVLGDNRNNSEDSHTGYTVPRENIIGKAWLSIWPPGEWGVIPNYAYANE